MYHDTFSFLDGRLLLDWLERVHLDNFQCTDTLFSLLKDDDWAYLLPGWPLTFTGIGMASLSIDLSLPDTHPSMTCIHPPRKGPLLGTSYPFDPGLGRISSQNWRIFNTPSEMKRFSAIKAFKMRCRLRPSPNLVRISTTLTPLRIVN